MHISYQQITCVRDNIYLYIKENQEIKGRKEVSKGFY
jgi:hypothetical protein